MSDFDSDLLGTLCSMFEEEEEQVSDEGVFSLPPPDPAMTSTSVPANREEDLPSPPPMMGPNPSVHLTSPPLMMGQSPWPSEYWTKLFLSSMTITPTGSVEFFINWQEWTGPSGELVFYLSIQDQNGSIIVPTTSTELGDKRTRYNFNPAGLGLHHVTLMVRGELGGSLIHHVNGSPMILQMISSAEPEAPVPEPGPGPAPVPMPGPFPMGQPQPPLDLTPPASAPGPGPGPSPIPMDWTNQPQSQPPLPLHLTLPQGSLMMEGGGWAGPNGDFILTPAAVPGPAPPAPVTFGLFNQPQPPLPFNLTHAPGRLMMWGKKGGRPGFYGDIIIPQRQSWDIFQGPSSSKSSRRPQPQGRGPRSNFPVAAPIGCHTQSRFTCKPWGITADPATLNIFIANQEGQFVNKYTSTGELITTFHFDAFSRPTGLAFDSTRLNLLVTDKANHRVVILTSQGQFVLKFGSLGHGPGQFNNPWGVAVSSDGSSIAVADAKNLRVQLFNADGIPLRNIYSFNSMNNFKLPRGVAFDPSGSWIYVSDFHSNCLYRFDLGLTQMHTVVTPRKLKRPQGLCVDSYGNILVADSRNDCIRVIRPDGILLGTIMRSTTGRFNYPMTIIMIAPDLFFVIDESNCACVPRQ